MRANHIRNTQAITSKFIHILNVVLDIRRPCFIAGKLASDLRDPLLNTHEFENFKYYNIQNKGNEKLYIWDNTWADIGDGNKYRGQR